MRRQVPLQGLRFLCLHICLLNVSRDAVLAGQIGEERGARGAGAGAPTRAGSTNRRPSRPQVATVRVLPCTASPDSGPRCSCAATTRSAPSKPPPRSCARLSTPPSPAVCHSAADPECGNALGGCLWCRSSECRAYWIAL